MPSFATRFLALAAHRSPLCLGIDPATELLDQWGVPRSAAGVGRFCDLVMEAMGDTVAIVKPQSAFFEQFGPEGMAELVRVVRMIRERGALALVDVKRGDIGHTLIAYANAMLGAESPFGADAMTVSAYLGFGALKPLLDTAVARKAGVIVVVRSSNPEGRALQDARLADGRTVATALADDISAYNAASGERVGPGRRRHGSYHRRSGHRDASHLDNALILAPGIGAQGATFDDVSKNFGTATERVIPAVSRGILAKGPSVTGLREAIQRHVEGAHRMRAPR